jgi:AP-1-like factor
MAETILTRQLEAKVAELENKSYSSTAENENLRAILKRLQEENVRLKQSAFTFAVPRAGSTSNSSPTNGGPSPVHRVNSNNSKPPTPPYSHDEPLKTVNDAAPINTRLPHRMSSSGMSGGMAASPESLQSVGSSNSSRNVLNGNSPMRFDSFSNFSTDTGITPPSVASDNKSDFDALWASFYPSNNGQPVPPTPSGLSQQQYQAALASPNALGQFLAQQTAQNKAQPPAPQQSMPQTRPNMAYRDPSANTAQPAQEYDWSTTNNTSIDDFLASLTGANATNDENPVSAVDDELFNQQLQQMLAGAQFDSSQTNTFSPTNYLNMSPSPLNSVSNSTSPQSAQVSGASYSASPESSNASSAPPRELPTQKNQMPNCISPSGQVVNVVDANGNIVKPSDLWVKMGMQHQDNVDNVVIDDLCDQMRAKAKCHDGESLRVRAWR